jgi:hypothetical protein
MAVTRLKPERAIQEAHNWFLESANSYFTKEQHHSFLTLNVQKRDFCREM